MSLKDFLRKTAVLTELGRLTVGASLEPAGVRGDAKEHQLSTHDHLWSYLPYRLFDPAFTLKRGFPLMLRLEPGTCMSEALKSTNLMVFFGAVDSPQLAEAMAHGAFCLVFEPDKAHLRRFLDSKKPAKLAGNKVLFFVGDPEEWGGSLHSILPTDLSQEGCPAFFLQPGIEEVYSGYVSAIRTMLEVLHFRNEVYNWEGQWGAGDVPSRKITRGLFYDQQLHLYQNAAEYVRRPGLEALKGAFAGETALIVAAGPELNNKLEYVRANMEKAVVIAVNSSLRVLLDAGIEPHFTVFNDTSISSAKTLEGLPRLKKSILVAHCLSGIGDTFERIVLFGSVPSLTERLMLRLYGSVLTTGFSLARHLGCSRTVLVGAQLCSESDARMGYASGTTQAATGHLESAGQQPRWHRYPRLYPTKDASGGSVYTTANFMDSALWLLDEIANSGIEVVNTTHRTILYGEGVMIDETFAVPGPWDVEKRFSELDLQPPDTNVENVRSYLVKHRETWTQIVNTAEHFAAQAIGRWPGLFESMKQVVDLYDQAGISFLLQRYPGFDNLTFVLYYEHENEEYRVRGVVHYLNCLACMSATLLEAIESSLEKLEYI